MTEAEQFLDDMEAIAQAATPGIRSFLIITENGDDTEALYAGNKPIITPEYFPNRAGDAYDQRLEMSLVDQNFILNVDPAAVLRLVGMVRWLAEQIREDDGGSKTWIQAAYHATEKHT